MPRSVLTIGNFDGVHVGHRAIVARARAVADAQKLRVIALTFDPHPARVLRPGQEPARLVSIDEKTALLRDAGADEVCVLAPTPALLALSPREFVAQVLAGHEPATIVEGGDFRFGQGRAGDVAMLADLGREYGFSVIVLDRVLVALEDQLLIPAGSSAARWLLGHGRVGDAARVLGRPYALSARVIGGEKRGRTIGTPTANLDMSALAERVVPGDGVYAAWVELADRRRFAAAVNVGLKPTFDARTRAIEAHLLDFTGDLYDQVITVRFVRWLRDQRAFAGVESLKAQIGRDVRQVRAWAAMGLLEAVTDSIQPPMHGAA